MKTIIIYLFATVTFVQNLKAQTTSYKPKDLQLYNTIAHMDSVCFNALNKQDITTLGKVFAENVEFYNDGGSITTYQQTMANFKAMFDRNKTSGLKRELVKGSLEVYPLKDYGAIEVGVHTFTHVENGKTEVGIFKFVNIWQLKDGEWKITRVVSYNH